MNLSISELIDIILQLQKRLTENIKSNSEVESTASSIIVLDPDKNSESWCNLETESSHSNKTLPHVGQSETMRRICSVCHC